MRYPLSPFLVGVCVCLAPIAAAKTAAVDAPEPGPAGYTTVAPEVEEAFRAALTADQAVSLTGRHELGTLSTALSPKQRNLVRERLFSLEARTRDSSVLDDILQAYLVLGRPDDALRVAAHLTRAGPNRASVHVLLAEAWADMGRYEDAEDQAREALRIDPADRSALALLKMNEGRVSLFAGAAPAKSVLPSNKAQPGESKFTYQLRQHFRAGNVPPLSSPWKPESAPPLPFSLAAILVGAGLGAVMAKGKPHPRSLLAGAVACAGLGAGGVAYSRFASNERAPLVAGRV